VSPKIRLIKNVTKIRMSTYLFIAFLCVALGVCKLKAETEDAGRAAVKNDSLTVFSRASSKSETVKKLKKGDVVTIEFELEGTEEAWCSIIEEGQTSISGYVQCQHLQRQIPQRKSWTSLGPSGAKESNIGKPSYPQKTSPSSKLRPYSDITVTLYMTSW